ncbi:MAG: hypothetical protein HON90_05455 [Halobacteriovoraceae bacterium]|jgi:hypothetical protein|nr:hypothetical protein [Halobacteriovoraceae bacterium]
MKISFFILILFCILPTYGTELNCEAMAKTADEKLQLDAILQCFGDPDNFDINAFVKPDCNKQKEASTNKNCSLNGKIIRECDYKSNSEYFCFNGTVVSKQANTPMIDQLCTDAYYMGEIYGINELAFGPCTSADQNGEALVVEGKISCACINTKNGNLEWKCYDISRSSKSEIL